MTVRLPPGRNILGQPGEVIAHGAADPPLDLLAASSVSKVGPKGYVHGWIYEGPLYHGTSSEVADHIAKHGFDPEKSGSGGTNVYGGGLYLTSDKDAAHGYAKAHGGIALVMHASIKNPAHDTDKDVLKGQVLQSTYGSLSAVRRAGIGKDVETQLKTSLDKNLDKPVTAEEAAKYKLPATTSYRDVVSDVSDDELENAITGGAATGGNGNWLMTSFLQNRGYDGVVVGDPSKPSEVVVFDPKDVQAKGRLDG
jgi:ADP-ribosyltransferase-like protein